MRRVSEEAIYQLRLSHLTPNIDSSALTDQREHEGSTGVFSDSQSLRAIVAILRHYSLITAWQALQLIVKAEVPGHIVLHHEAAN